MSCAETRGSPSTRTTRRPEVSDVVVSQPAVLMLKHVSPRGSIILPLVAIFATGVAIVMALVTDTFQFRRERSERPFSVNSDSDLGHLAPRRLAAVEVR